MCARSPVVYNTYDPSWQELPALTICAGLKELLSGKKLKIQVFNVYKGENEFLGECEVRTTASCVASDCCVCVCVRALV